MVTSGGLMECLRVATRPEHESVEDAFRAATSLVDVDSYRRLLQRFHRVVSPLEELAEEAGAFDALNLDLEAHQRRYRLARDIRFLGFEPLSQLAYDRMTVNEAVGALYVLEGSTLGGQIIARLVKSSTGLTREGIEYFSGHGKQTAAHWRQFSEAVDRWERTGIRGAEVLMSARRTFQAFERSLRQIT